MKIYQDQELIRQYFRGEQKSLTVLFSRYLRLVYSLAYRYTHCRETAEDLTQEIFVKAWRNLKKFDQQRDFKPWLMTIAKNTMIDYWRQHRQDVLNIALESPENEAEFFVDPAPLAEEILQGHDFKLALADNLQRLTRAQRRAITLRHERDLTFKEISQVLGESLNTVKSRYRRALEKLGKLFVW